VFVLSLGRKETEIVLSLYCYIIAKFIRAFALSWTKNLLITYLGL